MTKNPLSRWIATLGLALAVSLSLGTTQARAATPAALAAPASPTKAAATKPADDAEQRYAQREAAHPEAAAFNGDGSAIYIGGSTLAVVLIVVLVVVLL